VLATTHQITEAFNQSGSENENVLLVVLTDDDGLSPADYATYRTLADNLRPDTRDILMLQDFVHIPTSEAPDDAVDDLQAGRHAKQTEAAQGTDSDIVALRS
jgi:uncharacterized membrane protein YdfJ with MMPL/SSD domain